MYGPYLCYLELKTNLRITRHSSAFQYLNIPAEQWQFFLSKMPFRLSRVSLIRIAPVPPVCITVFMMPELFEHLVSGGYQRYHMLQGNACVGALEAKLKAIAQFSFAHSLTVHVISVNA